MCIPYPFFGSEESGLLVSKSLSSDSGEGGSSMPNVDVFLEGGEPICESEVSLGSSRIATESILPLPTELGRVSMSGAFGDDVLLFVY